MSDSFILVTGGNGFIGSHVVDRLLKLGEKPLLLIREQSDLSKLNDVRNKVSFLKYADYIGDTEISRVKGVIHLATMYKRFHKPKDIEEIIRANITLPTKILEKSIELGAKFIINTGTFFRYDLSYKVLDETTATRPYNLYASTKISFEKILDFFAWEKGLKAATLVLFSPYGPRDNPYKLIPSIIRNSLNQQCISLSNGTQRMDFTFVADIVDAYIRSINFLNNSGNSSHELFNIGTGRNYSVKEVVGEIEHLTGKTLIKSWDGPAVDSFDAIADNSKARDKLGWVPSFDLAEGLQHTIDYFREA